MRFSFAHIKVLEYLKSCKPRFPRRSQGPPCLLSGPCNRLTVKFLSQNNFLKKERNKTFMLKNILLSKDDFIWEYKVYKSVVSPWATSAVVNHNPHVLIHLFKNPLSINHMASLYYLLFCAFVFITDEYRLLRQFAYLLKCNPNN